MNSLNKYDDLDDDEKAPKKEHSFFDDLRKELDTSFPLSGAETDEDLREAIGEENEEDDTYQKQKPVTYPLKAQKRIEDMTEEDKQDDDVPPKSEWRGF